MHNEPQVQPLFIAKYSLCLFATTVEPQLSKPLGTRGGP